MPTPDESSVVSPTRPNVPSISSRASFTTCPPEEERDGRALAPDTRVDTPPPPPPAVPLNSQQAHETRATAEETSQTLNAQSSTTQERLESDSQLDKGDHAEEAGISTPETAPNPADSPDAPSDGASDVRLAQSMAMAALDAQDEAGDCAPRYLYYPPLSEERTSPHSTTSFLHPGSKFRGTQRSDRQVYDVQVEIKHVDLAESFLCGYLRIQGLTDDHPTLTTFFEGEIIGNKHLFRTTHPTWNSSEKIDLQHWARFPPFRPLARSARASQAGFTLKNYLDRDHLFMRWKEYFLVPDHRVKSISGASFEGFYYICFDQRVGSVQGIYFHAKSEKFQQLDLCHVPDGGCMGAVEFR